MIHSLWVGVTTVGAIGLFSGLARSTTLRGKIQCEKSWSSSIVHVVGLAVAIAAALSINNAYAAIAVGVLIAALCVSFVTDVRYGLIFDVVTIPCALFLGTFAWFEGTLVQALWGGATCAAIILLIFLMSTGRGIGLGDLKLAACIGLALGVRYGVIAVGLAFIAGGVHGTALLLTRCAKKGDALRFAPYLALGSGLAIVASWFSV